MDLSDLYTLFSIILAFIMLIILYLLIFYFIGITCYDYCMAHVFTVKRSYNKFFSCCRKKTNTSIIVPFRRVELVHIGKTPSGLDEYNIKSREVILDV